MADYPRRKRPPKNRKKDYIVRALSRLLEKYLKDETDDSNPSTPRNLPPARGPLSSGYRRPSGHGSAYSPRYHMHYKPVEDAKLPELHKREPSYPRESKPFVQSLPQPRHGPDVEELLRRLEDSSDERLVEKVLQRLEDESQTTEKAVIADSDKTGLENTEQNASVDTVLKATDASASKEKELEKNGLEALTEPLSHKDELEGRIATGELDWLNEELDETFVELTSIEDEGELQDVLVLEKPAGPVEHAGPEQPIAPVPEVEPAIRPSELEPPLADIIDPIAELEPDLEEAEEEGEPQ